MSIDGRIANQVRFIFDDSGSIVGYRNDLDAEVPAHFGARMPVFIGPFRGLPSAADAPGAFAIVTDVGADWIEVRSNGARWRATAPVCLPPMPTAGSYTKSDLDADMGVAWSCTLPAGFMGPSGRIVMTPVVSYPNSTADKIIEVLINGTFQVYRKVRNSASNYGDVPYIEVENRNNVASQISCYSNTSGFVTAPLTAAITVSTAAINTDTTDLLIQLRVGFAVASTGSANISVPRMRGVYYPA